MIVNADNKKRARLNIISHLLSHVPYEEIKRERVKLPKRDSPGAYREPDYPYKYIPEKY